MQPAQGTNPERERLACRSMATGGAGVRARGSGHSRWLRSDRTDAGGGDAVHSARRVDRHSAARYRAHDDHHHHARPRSGVSPHGTSCAFRRGGAAAGTAFEQIVVTNVGAVTCRVGGHPRLVATMADGTHGPLAVRRLPHGSFPGGGRVPTNLAHGATATIGLATNDACPALNGRGMKAAAHAHTVASLEVVLPGGAGPPMVVGNLGPLDTACGLSESQLGARIPPQGNPPAPAAGTIGSLRARLYLTAPVRPGKTLSYEVTLTDPGRLPVALRPCPRYTEWMAGKTTAGRWRATKHAYALNCAPVGHIPAGGSATFAMRLRVPANLTPGLAKLSWGLIGYWSVVTGAAAHIGP